MNKSYWLAAVVLTACGDDPIEYSDDVGIEVKVKSGEVVNESITAEKSITTESGNPYGAFVSDARNRLGRDPGNIVLDKVTIMVGAQSTNVTMLEQVVTGDVWVKFLINDTNNTYPAGHWPSPSGGTAVSGHASFELVEVADVDVEKVIGGSFKVVLTSPAAANFATANGEASLQLTFTFTAFE